MRCNGPKEVYDQMQLYFREEFRNKLPTDLNVPVSSDNNFVPSTVVLRAQPVIYKSFSGASIVVPMLATLAIWLSLATDYETGGEGKSIGEVGRGREFFDVKNVKRSLRGCASTDQLKISRAVWNICWEFGRYVWLLLLLLRGTTCHGNYIDYAGVEVNYHCWSWLLLITRNWRLNQLRTSTNLRKTQLPQITKIIDSKAKRASHYLAYQSRLNPSRF